LVSREAQIVNRPSEVHWRNGWAESPCISDTSTWRTGGAYPLEADEAPARLVAPNLSWAAKAGGGRMS